MLSSEGGAGRESVEDVLSFPADPSRSREEERECVCVCERERETEREYTSL